MLGPTARPVRRSFRGGHPGRTRLATRPPVGIARREYRATRPGPLAASPSHSGFSRPRFSASLAVSPSLALPCPLILPPLPHIELELPPLLAVATQEPQL